MLKLAQYENMFSIYMTLIVLIPSIILCFFGKKSKILDIVTSLLVILSIIGFHTFQLLEFVVFIIYETVLVYFFRFFRKRCSSELIYFGVFAMSMAPLLYVRISANSVYFFTVIGFAGVSYMCFKIWQILFEIHDGKVDRLNLGEYLIFTIFFPSYSSGPIARFEDFREYYSNPKLDNYFCEYFCPGFKKLLMGLFYKFAIAFFVNKYLLGIIPGEMTVLTVIAYMYSYTVYLFFDFAGYSNIAIGVGMLMGIKLPENFNKPFLACNMKEFWSRWHMSLSTWFNDYVFGRFVLNNVRNGLFKSTKTASRWAYLFTMTVMGLWHGFSIHYVIYGLYEGILLVITDIWVKSKAYRNFRKKKYYTLVSRVICFQFVAFGMLLFSGHYFFR